MSQFDNRFNNSKLNIKDEWGTPPWIFRRLNFIFRFTVDAAANGENRKVRHYWSYYDNGLQKTWQNHRVFCNPPFTKGRYKFWINKAVSEFLLGDNETVMVLPFKPETRAFKPVWKMAKYLIIPYRRIRYVPPKGVKLQQSKGKGSPTFPSCIAMFTNRKLERLNVVSLSKIGYVLNLEKGYLRV